MREEISEVLKNLIGRVWSGGTADSSLYGLVAQEIADQRLDVGLWAKAFAAADGNAERAKARYLDLRVQALKEQRRAAERIASQQRRQLEHDQVRLQKAEAIAGQIGSLQAQLWNLHDSPEAKRAQHSRRRVTATIMLLGSVPTFLLFRAFAVDWGSATLLFGFLGVPGLGLLWMLVDSGPAPSRADLLQKLAELERKRSRT